MDSAITRRGFGQWIGGALAVGTSLAGTGAQAQGTITIAQAVDRIKAKLAAEGVPWRASNFDGFKTGDPNVTLTGVATCFQPTFNVLRRAAAAKRNLVVSHESCFWDGFDPLDVVKDDPVAKAKIRFVAENKMAVWRIHDHWHAHRPEPMGGGLARKLGWSAYWTDNVRPRYFTIPEMSLGEMALHVQRQLGTRNVVAVGEPSLRVRTVGDCAHILSSVLGALRKNDVVLVGETPQHDTFEYIRDAVSLGQKKGIVMISHEGLEEWGMEAFAEWFRPAVPEVPVEWISSGDPFYIPPVRG